MLPGERKFAVFHWPMLQEMTKRRTERLQKGVVDQVDPVLGVLSGVAAAGGVVVLMDKLMHL